jgi:uncharacterized protein (TIGR02145 family)
MKRWGDGTTTAVDPAKRPYDPCPAGWKVPSSIQWRSIFKKNPSAVADETNYSSGDGDANIWTFIGYGYKVGDALYLPVAAYRSYSNGGISGGIDGNYWSSTWCNTSGSYYLAFNSSLVNPGHHGGRAYGVSVRCVSE